MRRRTLTEKTLIWISVMLVSLLMLVGCGDTDNVSVSGAMESEEAGSSVSETVSVENSGSEESSSGVESPETEGSTQTEENPETEDSTQTGESSETEAGTQEPGASEPAAWAAAPTISQTIWQDNRFAEDGTLLVEGYFQALEVSGDGYATVAESVNTWRLQQEEIFSENVDLYEEYALDAVNDAANFYGYRNSVECNATRTDSSVISLKVSYYEYSGGAHGNYGSVGITFDAQSGKELSFWDLTEERKAFAQHTLEYCLEQVALEYEEGLFEDYADTIRAVWQEEPNWYLDAAGITVIFTPYEIGPYAMGEVYVTLPYYEFEEFLKPEYLMGAREGVSVLTEGVAAWICLGNQYGESELVRIYEEPQEEGAPDYGFRKYLLEVGEQTEAVAEIAWLNNIYIVQQESGRTFMLFDGDMASDDYVTYVYELTDGQIRKTYESQICTAIREGTVTPEGLQLGIRVDVLGTYTAYGDYRISEEVGLEAAGEWYTIDNLYAGGVLTTVRELPVTVDGQETVLPAGSRLRIVGTDMKGILRYELEGSPEEGEIHFERGTDGWQVYIDGVSEKEYFEDLPYAG